MTGRLYNQSQLKIKNMKSIFFFVASLMITVASFAQGKGKGSQNTLTVDFTAIGINSAIVTITDLKTQEVITVSSSFAPVQKVDVNKNHTFVVRVDFTCNEPDGLHFWLGWLPWNGLGISFYAPGTSWNSTSPINPVTFEKDAVLLFEIRG